jgi:hypothetical protein
MHALVTDAAQGVHNNAALFSNLDRASAIWRSIAAKHPGVLKGGGMHGFLETTMPNVYRDWQNRRKRNLVRTRSAGR